MFVYWLLFRKECFEFRLDIEDEWLNGRTTEPRISGILKCVCVIFIFIFRSFSFQLPVRPRILSVSI